jgi:aspartyl-tRNA(Asn)/glutamyl-tRNA(Gln) amidotransferase subunit B
VTAAALVRGWEVVIGLETHAQLSTVSKIFSGAPTAFGGAPNAQAAPVDLGLPGTLPVANRGAVERAIRFGLAVGATVAPVSIFARKNYFYPDLPKGYQISQYETPVVQGGSLAIRVGDATRTIRLTRAHLEEDAGKSLHEGVDASAVDTDAYRGGWSGIDLNRAGTPLLEIVSEPDLRSSVEAVAYARALHALVVWLGICDGNMQEGSFRCDANVSVRRPGAPFGTRREIKNLNSFRFLREAIDYEVQWQIDLIEDGGTVQQATVLFDPAHGETRTMRTKEDAHDYRYFPDPDLPPLAIAREWVERVRGTMPELPEARAERLRGEHGLTPDDAAVLTQSRSFADWFEAAAGASGGHGKLVANWMAGEISRRLNAAGAGSGDAAAIPLAADALGRLVARIGDGTLTNAGARKVFDALWSGAAADVDATIDSLGLRATPGDDAALAAIVDRVLAAQTKSVAEYRAGKEKAFNALVGQAMKASEGKADPARVGAVLREKLGPPGTPPG